MKKHAFVLQTLAKKAIEKEICHTYYLQVCLYLLRHFVGRRDRMVVGFTTCAISAYHH
jgi:hypothetical protein